MAKPEADKAKKSSSGGAQDKDKQKKSKPATGGADKGKDAGKAKEAKKAKDAAPEKDVAVEPEKPKAAPRPPVDPRLKILKKFHGKFLPKGPLRDRLKALMERWNSGPDHGGVTLEELKALYEDWKASRLKRARTAKVSG